MARSGGDGPSGCVVARPRLLEELDRLCVVPNLRVHAAQKPEEVASIISVVRTAAGIR
jgi:hypothetical protein